MKIRPIVKAAFEVDELVHQFGELDVADRVLKVPSTEDNYPSNEMVVAAVNDQYSDDNIIDAARWKLDVVQENIDDLWYDDENIREYKRDKVQLSRFIKRFA